MWNPFSKTYDVKCCDGTTKTVHKDIKNAFPLALTGFDAKASVGLTTESIKKAELSGSVQTKVEGLLFQLDEFNNSLVIKFRAAYEGYKSDPCSNNQFLLNQITTISERQEFFGLLKMQCRGFIELAKANPEDSKLITEKYNQVICEFNSNSMNAIFARKAIAESKGALENMKEND
jgi:hypothetical protein